MATKPSPLSGGVVKNRESESSGSQQASVTSRKTVVAYRPVSKTKRSVSRVGLSACASASGKVNKSPEDLRDELIDIKKSMASVMEENTVLKAKIRRRDDENLKKDKQILELLDVEKNEELRRILTERKSSANMSINQLKQRVLKLELGLKEKEQALKKAQVDLKSSKVNEMKIQMETYYQEILRLKTLNQGRYNSNSNNMSYDDLLNNNRTLGEENNILKQELDRALAVEGIFPVNDYHSLSKVELLATISDLEKRLSSQTSVGLIKVKLGSRENREKESDEDDFELKLKQLREDRYYYHQMAESKDTDNKNLLSIISNLQKELELLRSQSNLNASICLQNCNSQSSSASDIETMPTARGSSAPARTPRQRARLNLQEPFVMSSTVRKIPSKTAEPKKPPSSPSPRLKPEDASKTNVQAFDMYKLAAYNYCNYNYCYNYCYNYDYNNYDYNYDQQSRLAYGFYGDPRKQMSPRSDGRMMMRRGFRNGENDTWIMQATVRKVIEKNDAGAGRGQKSPTKPSSASSKRPTTYTMLTTTENEATTSAEEKKSKAAGDSQRDVDYEQVQAFRMNLAAKKIQRRWKRYQEAEEAEELSIYHKANNAAFTIQSGWKRHRVKQFTYSDRSLVTDDENPPSDEPAYEITTDESDVKLQKSNSVCDEEENTPMVIGGDSADSGKSEHDDDDDVVC